MRDFEKYILSELESIRLGGQTQLMIRQEQNRQLDLDLDDPVPFWSPRVTLFLRPPGLFFYNAN